jgi:hypothetical protein
LVGEPTDRPGEAARWHGRRAAERWPQAKGGTESEGRVVTNEKVIRLWANHLAFSMVKRNGTYRLYSRYTTPRSLAYKTTSLKEMVRWLNKWMRAEIVRGERRERGR